jgi:hypothetical protein
VPATLKLAQDALVRHLALEMLNRTVKTAVSDHDLYRLALNGFSNHRGSFQINPTKRGRNPTRSLADRKSPQASILAYSSALNRLGGRYLRAPMALRGKGPPSNTPGFAGDDTKRP